MYKSFAESAVLIGLMLLEIDCDLHRHSQRPFATTAATPLALKEASPGHRHWPKYISICIKASLKVPYWYAWCCLQSSKIRIAIQTAKASTPFDSQGRIAGPPALARIAFDMSNSFPESAILIGLMLLAIQ
jgi:hypothetical protein